MKRVWLGALAAIGSLMAVGCNGATSGLSPTEKEFQKLYKQYSTRFHERMVTEAETLAPVQITAEAARVWDETFALHKDVLKARVAEILNDLDASQPIQEDLYAEVASGARVEPTETPPKGIVLKQFLWSPVGAAQMALNNWLARLLQQNSFAMRSILTANAALTWEAIDKNPDRPKLVLRQGPMLFLVDLSRTDDYYQVDKVRWMRPKSMGPIVIPQPPAATTPTTTGAVPATTPTTTGAVPAATTPAPAATTPAPAATTPAPAETTPAPVEKPAEK